MATLTCNLNDEQFDNYSHRRNISGELSLTNTEKFEGFEIYLNDVKLPSPNISIIENTIYFAMEIFIQSGINNLKLIVKYMNNNIVKSIVRETTYNLDYTEDEKEKEYLLTNFIGNDFEKTKLFLGSAKLSYKDNNANETGLPKELNINTDIPSNFFELLGDEAEYYRLDKNNIPKIYSDIIARPLFITFNSVSKIYDGTDDATNLLLNLIGSNNDNDWRYEFNKNHIFTDINNDQYDYANVGFLEGIGETLINKTIIYKSNDEIHLDDEIEIFNNDVNFNDFELNIDGVIGKYNIEQDKFEFINPGLNTEKYIIYQTIENIFDKICLIRQDITDEDTENIVESKFYIKFILNDEENVYKVIHSVIIKYKYRNNNESVQIHTKSDVDYVSLDFDSAKFDTKNAASYQQPILINNLQFTKGVELEDRSKNYQIAGYNFSGIIKQRPVKVGIKCLSKIYDGNNIVPIQIIDASINSEYDSGITKLIDNNTSGKISGDDLYVSCVNNNSLKDDNEHFDLQIGNTYCLYSTLDVGENKVIDIFETFLEGKDKDNYYIADRYIDTSDAKILPREIYLTINKITINSQTNEFILDYSFVNDISVDNLSININNIKIYGGNHYESNEPIDYTNTSSNTLDIFDLFFNYKSLTQPEWIETNNETSNVYSVNVGDTNTLWYNDKYRVAINRNPIRKVTTKSIANSLYFKDENNGLVFYESKDKKYKLYDGCQITIKNVYLDESNSKSNNYILNTHEYNTIIEII